METFDYVSTSNENNINNINDFTPSRGNAIVVGAGPAGALTAMSLARAGFQVDVFERRGPSSRLPSQGLVNTGVASSRTYNIVLNQRGVAALRTHGVDVDSFGVKLAGSVRHEQKGFKRPLRNPFFLFNLKKRTKIGNVTSRSTNAFSGSISINRSVLAAEIQKAAIETISDADYVSLQQTNF